MSRRLLSHQNPKLQSLLENSDHLGPQTSIDTSLSFLIIPSENKFKMCGTSFYTFWARCGHTTLEDKSCEAGNCVLEVPTQSTESNRRCRACNRYFNQRLSHRQRRANHILSKQRIAQELASYQAQLAELQAQIIAEQKAIAALDEERRQEELALSEISSHMLTLEQARRIVFLFNFFSECFPVGTPTTDIYNNRLRILQRALFNIPSAFMADWPIQQLENHSQALLEDTNARAEASHQAFEEYKAIKSRLSLDECRIRIGLMTNARQGINRDYGKYLDLTLLIRERQEQESIQNKLKTQRAFAISQLLEPVDIEELAPDEFSQRCTICMETYGEHSHEDLPSKLPCGHVFGTTCVTTWFMEHDTCGFCRHNYWAELGSPPPPLTYEPEAEELGDVYDGYEETSDMEDIQEEEIQERQDNHIQSPTWNFPQNHQWSDDNELVSVDSDTKDEEFEPVNDHDRSGFVAWGLSSNEDLGVGEDFNEDEIMRLLDDDQGSGMEY